MSTKINETKIDESIDLSLEDVLNDGICYNGITYLIHSGNQELSELLNTDFMVYDNNFFEGKEYETYTKLENEKYLDDLLRKAPVGYKFNTMDFGDVIIKLIKIGRDKFKVNIYKQDPERKAELEAILNK